MSNSPDLPTADPPARIGSPSRGRFTVQMVGLLISLALLAWCLSEAFSPQNRGKLESLKDVPAIDVAMLFALSALNLLISGAIFWLLIRPVKQLRLIDLFAVNALASLLAYLPFKLSIVARATIHNRRDGVPLATFGAWLAAFTIVLLGSLLPPIAALAIHPEADAIYFLSTLLGLVIMWALTFSAARFFAGDIGLARLATFALATRLVFIQRFFGSRIFAQLHAGFAMLASPGLLAAAFALRTLDLIAIALRFQIAARAAREPFTLIDSIIAASTYYILGVISPSGSLGAREGGTTGITSFLHKGLDSSHFSVTPLVVSAVEILVTVAGAAIAFLWLRPHRLFRKQP